MSRRVCHFRSLRGKDASETLANITRSTQVARDKNGAVITRPIKHEKAVRLAAALHRAKSKI